MNAYTIIYRFLTKIPHILLRYLIIRIHDRFLLLHYNFYNLKYYRII